MSLLLRQPPIGCPSIEIEALFARPPLTLPVSAVIDEENAYPELGQREDSFGVGGEVSALSMEEEDSSQLTQQM